MHVQELIRTLSYVLEDVAEVADILDAFRRGETRLAGSLSCFENLAGQEDVIVKRDTPLRLPMLEEILERGLETDSSSHKVWLSTGDSAIEACIYIERDGTAVLRVEHANDSTIYVETHSPEVQAYADFRLPC